MNAQKSKHVVLASRPEGAPTPDNFRIEEAELPPLKDGEVLLRIVYLSLDPYMRGRMNAGKSYSSATEIGTVMEGGTVAKVIESRHEKFAPGDLVLSFSGWRTHAVAKGSTLRKLDPSAAPPSTALGVLGMPGFAAYSGLLTLGRPAAGETIVVAAASGPVGSVVGQIARIKGARAVGIAGGPKKCAFVRDELGFDAAVDHRAHDFAAQLAAACPNGIDVYFENVGGAVWDAVFPLLNNFGRVPVCGLVSQYNTSGPGAGPDRVPLLMQEILAKSLTLRGFTQREFIDQRPAFYKEMANWIETGRVRYREDFVDGLEAAPEALIGLLEGRNFGKLIVRVSNPG